MIKINKQIKCRTCLNATKGLQSLAKVSTDEAKQQKSYAEMLKEIANINIMNDKCNELPQVICGCCTRKLKAAHAFVQQAQEVNEKLCSMLQEQENEYKHRDCLQESQIDFQTCLEIKMEHDDMEANKEEKLEKDVQLKLEETESKAVIYNSFMDQINDEKERVMESPKDSLELQIPDTNVKLSDSECNIGNTTPHVMSESDKDYNEHDLNLSDHSDLPTELKSPRKTKIKKKKLRKLKTPKDHPDPLDNESNDDIKNDAINDDMLPARCEDCDKVFPNSSLLNRHRRGTHVPEELKIQCPYCEAKFSRRHNMYAHMRVIHKDKNLEEHQLSPKKVSKQHPCQECARSYSNKYKLLAHIKTRHNPENIQGSAEKEVNPVKPKKRFLCTLCGLTFDSQSNLNIHYRRHTGEKPFKCDYCDRAYHRLYDAQVHLRSHTGEKPYQCTVCEKAFRRSNKLKIHMRTHTNERPYKCTQCEKAFKQSKDLNIHKRTHTGERPYKCTVCQSTFTQSNSLRLHQTKQKHFEMSNPVEDSQVMYQQSLSMIEENKIII